MHTNTRSVRRVTTGARTLALTVLTFAAFAMGSHAMTAHADDAATPTPVEVRVQPSDHDVSLAVQSAMWDEDAVPSHMIDVEVDEGVVTLSGEVRNLLAKQRAVRLCSTLRGVRSIVDRIEVDPPKRSDNALAGDVREALLLDPATDAYEVAVLASDGEVTLTGAVDSWTEKMLCRTVASGVRGVKAIDDQLRLVPADSRPATEIIADVERRLESDVWIDAEPLHVSVSDGTAHVSGTVGSLAEKDRVVAKAWVAGVSNVDVTGISVRWWEREPTERTEPYPEISDKRIESAVKDAFLYDPRVFSFEPSIHVENGVVTLTGTVDSAAARRAAEMDARNTMGVWRVRNFLKVRPEDEVEDSALMREVRRAMLRDPWVDRYDITVHAVDGKVYLHGQVDSPFEKRHASRLAERVTGVRDVANRLGVDSSTISVKSDLAIREDIDDEFMWSPFVDGDQIAVTVDDGVATLTGTVDSWHERRMATQNAKEGGAIAVVNELDVRTSNGTLLD